MASLGAGTDQMNLVTNCSCKSSMKTFLRELFYDTGICDRYTSQDTGFDPTCELHTARSANASFGACHSEDMALVKTFTAERREQA